MGDAPDYAFPHSADDEARRLELLQQRLDPITTRRLERLGIRPGAACLRSAAAAGLSPAGSRSESGRAGS